MRFKTANLMVLAVLCCSGGRSTQELPAGQETVKVLVARKDLGSGLICRRPEELFEERFILRDVGATKTLASFEEVKGRQLKYARREGDTISQDDLYNDDSLDLTWGLGSLPPARREVGLKASSEQRLGGVVLAPNSRIDIAVRLEGDKGSYLRVILRNVLVLRIGQLHACGEGKVDPSDRLFVALTPEDAFKLETVKGKGVLLFLPQGFHKETQEWVEDDLPRKVDRPPAQLEEAFKENTPKEPAEDAPGKDASTPKDGKVYEARKTVTFVTTVKIEVTVTLVSK